jgi:hypothetical protein
LATVVVFFDNGDQERFEFVSYAQIEKDNVLRIYRRSLLFGDHCIAEFVAYTIAGWRYDDSR